MIVANIANRLNRAETNLTGRRVRWNLIREKPILWTSFGSGPMSVVWIAIEPEDTVVHAYLLWVRIKHGWRARLDLDFVDGHPKLLPFFLRRDAQTENKRHF